MRIGLVSSLFLLLVACAQQPPHTTIQEQAHLSEAVQQQVTCARTYAKEVDDGISDASTAAFALALRCSREYDLTTEALSQTMDNDAQKQMIRASRSSQQEKVATFLPEIMLFRHSQRKP